MSTYRNSFRRRIDDTFYIWRQEMKQVFKDIENNGVRVTEILNDMLTGNN